jgi:hypothetical protein
MNRASLVALSTGAIITSAAAIGIGAAHEPPSVAMTRSQYEASLAAIREAFPREAERCAALPAADREPCRARALARELVLGAALEERYRGTPQATRAAQRAKIEARYEVARARCAVLRGFERDQCYIAAHALRGRALLESQDPYAGAG